MGMRTDKKTIGVMAVLAALVLIASVGILFPARAADEFSYLAVGRAIHEGTSVRDDFARFPGYSLLLGGSFFLLQHEITPIVLNALLLLGIAWLTKKIAHKMKADEQVAFWASLTSPFLIFFATRALSEVLFTFLLMVCVWLLLDKKYFWTGVMSGLLFTVRYTGGLIGVATVVHWYFHDNRDWKKLVEYGIGLIVGLLPVMVINYTFTGNPFGLVLEFFSGTYQFGPNVFSLPDRIPSYILLSPLLVGGLLAAVFFRWGKLTRNAAMSVLAVFLVGLELYSLFGLVNIPQFRFIVPLVPLALVAFLSQLDLRSVKRQQIVYGLLVVGFLAGIGGSVAFNTMYEKNAMHEQAALFVERNCESAHSNLPPLVRWTHGENTPLEEWPQCVVDTKYEKAEVVVPQEYTPWTSFGKVVVYRLVHG